MSDLTSACRNAGLDSRQLRPIAHATTDGKVAVYIGAAWQDLPLGKAMNLRDQLGRAIAELQGKAHPSAGTDRTAPERFAVQMRQWRDGVRTAPLHPNLGTACAAELERRVLESLAQEATP
jgi:hypothetical protein